MQERGGADAPEIPRELLARLFQSAAGRLEEFRSDAERDVVEWRWHSAPAYDPAPLRFERSGETPGRLLAKPPKRMNNQSAYGIDAAGRIVVARDGQSGRHVGEYRETFYRRRDEGLEAYVFGPRPDGDGLWGVAVYSPPERPTQSVGKWAMGYGAERYQWDAAGVTKISSWSSEDGRRSELHNEFFATYDDDGRLRQVDRVQHLPSRSGPSTVYPPPKRSRARRYTTELRFDWALVSSLVRDVGQRKGLLWVKDSGSYLMDPDDPSSAVWADNAGRDTDTHTLFALCGTDDFAHHLSAEELRRLDVDRDGLGSLVITAHLLDDDGDDDPLPTLERFTLSLS